MLVCMSVTVNATLRRGGAGTRTHERMQCDSAVQHKLHVCEFKPCVCRFIML